MTEFERTEEPRPEGPKRNVATVALSLTLLAGVGVAFAAQSSDTPDTIATDDNVTTTIAVTTTTLAPVFVEAESSVTPAPQVVAASTTTKKATTTTRATTRPTTSTTLAPTTTIAPTTVPETLPAQQTQPIAPPADPRGYEEQNQIGRILIPKIGIDWPLLEGIRMTTLDKGPGHWPGTAMPGQVGNVVVAGHRTSHGAPFRNLDQLDPGDTVAFETANGVINYTVTGTQIVGPDALWITNPTSTATATLFACHPPGSIRQRIVVSLALS